MCRISSRRLQRWPYGMLYDIVRKYQNIENGSFDLVCSRMPSLAQIKLALRAAYIEGLRRRRTDGQVISRSSSELIFRAT
jgi:hypothetical protein